MDWNAALYQRQHHFVSHYGETLLSLLPSPQTGYILDIGCGTGELTALLAQRCDTVIGMDASYSMVAVAQQHYPHIPFICMDACDISWQDEFDVVFSNAVFHWIARQTLLHEKIFRSLRPEGRLLCEFGAAGNIGHIQSAFAQTLRELGYAYQSPFYFPSLQEHESLLRQAGFTIQQIDTYERPTPLQGGEKGLTYWLTQFFASDLQKMPPAQQEYCLERVQSLLRSVLWNGQEWVADYKRIRVAAVKV